MIRVEHVAKYFGEKLVLRDVNFQLASGEIVGLVGPSGGGKSVLLKLLGNVIEPSSGKVHHFSGPSSNSDQEHKPSVGFLFQEGALFDSMTVLENVVFPLLGDRQRATTPDEYRQAFEILEEVGLAKAYAKVPGQLSGGMRRRVALARALVTKPQLVLLDDPTGGLDPVAASVIIDLIKSLREHYKLTVVLVSHDIRRLLPNVDRVLALFEGVIACDLPPAELAEKAPKNVLHFLATRFDFSTFQHPAAP